jgi:hypothetical protein
LSTTQHADDEECIAKINELIAQKVFLIVEGADRLPLPSQFQSRAATTSAAAETARTICSLVIETTRSGRSGCRHASATHVVVPASAYAELRAQRERLRSDCRRRPAARRRRLVGGSVQGPLVLASQAAHPADQRIGADRDHEQG